MRAAVALLVVLAAACGGGEASAPTAAPASPTATSPSPTGAPTAASLVLHEDAAERRAFDADAFAAAGDGEDLFVADRVRTDATGFAEIRYLDGSLTRLDVDTEVEVVELAGSADAPDVVLDMDLGRTWHHVTDHPDTRYVVETGVATATVRGTTFLVTCPDETTCTFVVFDGTVELSAGEELLATLGAGEALTITVAADAAPTLDEDPAAVATAAADPWVQENAGMDDVELPDTGAGVAEALAGDWTVDFVVTEASGRPIQGKAQGERFTRDFAIVPVCDGGRCVLEISRGTALSSRTDTWEPVEDGYRVVATETLEDPNCGGAPVTSTSTITLRPVGDGAASTSFTVDLVETWAVSPAAASAGCTDSRVVGEGTGTRADT